MLIMGMGQLGRKNQKNHFLEPPYFFPEPPPLSALL